MTVRPESVTHVPVRLEDLSFTILDRMRAFAEFRPFALPSQPLSGSPLLVETYTRVTPRARPR